VTGPIEPTLLPPILGALTGAITGAIAGAGIGWWIAPTRAEREEQGRGRVDARRDVGAAIRAFDSSVRSYRQALYRQDDPDANTLETAAVSFAATVRHHSHVMPFVERHLVVQRVRRIVGRGFWREAELRPYDFESRLRSDAIALAAIADARPVASKGLFTTELVSAAPTDRQWDAVLDATAALRKKYP